MVTAYVYIVDLFFLFPSAHRKHFVGLDKSTDFLKDKVASAPDLADAPEGKPKRKR